MDAKLRGTVRAALGRADEYLRKAHEEINEALGQALDAGEDSDLTRMMDSILIGLDIMRVGGPHIRDASIRKVRDLLGPKGR